MNTLIMQLHFSLPSTPQPYYFLRSRLTRCHLIINTDHLFLLATACCRSVFRPALKLSFNSFALCRVCVSQSSKQMGVLMLVVSCHQVLDILSDVWTAPSTDTSLVLRVLHHWMATSPRLSCAWRLGAPASLHGAPAQRYR